MYQGDDADQAARQPTGRSNMAWIDLLAALAWVVLAIGLSLIISTLTRKGTPSPDGGDS
jgi:hypothetical protein